MSLRAQAAADLKAIVENTSEFAWPVTVTDPNGITASLTGLSNDVHQFVDPDTGQLISGRMASVVLRIASLTDAGLGMPKGIADSSKRPWVVRFDDVDGTPCTFKVASVKPDRTIGAVLCELEFYSYT